jgi:hypothetical protein
VESISDERFIEVGDGPMFTGYLKIFETVTNRFTDPALAEMLFIDAPRVMINVIHCMIELWRRSDDYAAMVCIVQACYLRD